MWCRTKRVWQPNVQTRPLFSEALQRQVLVDVTPAALKQMDRVGGLDMYLLTQPVAAQASLVAGQLRQLILQVCGDGAAACVRAGLLLAP